MTPPPVCFECISWWSGVSLLSVSLQWPVTKLSGDCWAGPEWLSSNSLLCWVPQSQTSSLSPVQSRPGQTTTHNYQSTPELSSWRLHSPLLSAVRRHVKLRANISHFIIIISIFPDPPVFYVEQAEQCPARSTRKRNLDGGNPRKRISWRKLKMDSITYQVLIL